MYPRSILHDSITNITPIHRSLGVMLLLQLFTDKLCTFGEATWFLIYRVYICRCKYLGTLKPHVYHQYISLWKILFICTICLHISLHNIHNQFDTQPLIYRWNLVYVYKHSPYKKSTTAGLWNEYSTRNWIIAPDSATTPKVLVDLSLISEVLVPFQRLEIMTLMHGLDVKLIFLVNIN